MQLFHIALVSIIVGAWLLWPLFVGLQREWPASIIGGLLLTTFLSVAAIGDYVIDHTPKPEVFALRTDSWECTSTYQVREFTGKVWVTVTKCSQYSRRDAAGG